MGQLIRKHWEGGEGMSRRDRLGCDYDAYLPDDLIGWDLSLGGDLVADLADADAATRDLNRSGVTHRSLEGLARFLLRAESVASSRIEGLQVGARRLLAAEQAIADGSDAADRTAVEILANIDAMDSAVEIGAAPGPVTIDDLLAIHRTLMAQSPTPELGGAVRQEQNWIGGSSYSPCSAAFIPPPPEDVPRLLDDLLAYVNGDDHAPLVQAAIAHAEFETIHPFADGNGRAGRALIHVVLRRRGLTPSFVPPISLVLATWTTDYIEGLTAFRPADLPDADAPTLGRQRSDAAQRWIRTFAAATNRACADARRYSEQIDQLDADWRRRLRKVRKGSSVELLLEHLPGVPLLTSVSAAALIGRSTAKTNDAIARLVDAGVLRQRNLGRQRSRVFEAPEVIEMFTRLERSLGALVRADLEGLDLVAELLAERHDSSAAEDTA